MTWDGRVKHRTVPGAWHHHITGRSHISLLLGRVGYRRPRSQQPSAGPATMGQAQNFAPFFSQPRGPRLPNAVPEVHGVAWESSGGLV